MKMSELIAELQSEDPDAIVSSAKIRYRSGGRGAFLDYSRRRAKRSEN